MRRPFTTFAHLLLTSHLLAQQPETPQPAAAPAAPTPPEPRATTPPPSVFTEAMVDPYRWRHLGPANPMGRMTDIDVHPARRRTWLVGTAGGGLWQTTNAGTTWRSLFDHGATVSIGDVAITPSNPDIVWVGTGEENARNSVQWGDGVYKSLDGGGSWAHMGLKATFQIGHIAIHPTDPDVVYVAALGRLWGECEERGVYRSRDGGTTWERVLFLDPRTGCIDVRLHPQQPDVVFACMYERKRDGFDGNDPAVRFGDHSGLWKSIDGGDNWRQLTNGLPSCRWGRSGIDLLASNPDTMVAIIETERSGWQKGDRKDRIESDPPDVDDTDRQSADRPAPVRTGVLGIGQDGSDGAGEAPGAVLVQLTEGGPAATAGLLAGDRITSVGGQPVKSYAELLEIARSSTAGDKVAVVFVRDGVDKTVDVTYGRREDASTQGRPNGPYSDRLFGQLANKQANQGELGHETGGVFRSDDRGETWRRLNSLTERPFYYSVIRIDPQTPEHIYCVGTSLWASFDGGARFAPIQRGIHVDFHGIWIDPHDGDHVVAVCDGGVNETFDRGTSWQVHTGFCAAQYYDVVADNSVPYNVVGGLQDNGTWLGPSRTRYREGITVLDWQTINGGDGFGAQTDPLEPWIVYATSQNGALGVLDVRNGNRARLQRDRPSDGAATWNWDAPFVLSPHNRLTLWHAGSHVFRGERHAHLDARAARAGHDPIQAADTMRMRCVSPRLGHTPAGTAVALAESPRVMGLLYTGTDDGALWRSDDGAHTWTRIDQNLPVLGKRYVSDLVPSHFADDRVYLTLDGHRSDDFATYVFASEDRGASWQDLSTDLGSREPCYAVMEDPRNENLLYLGTEYGCHVSLDRGQRWFPLGNGLPTVAVRDLFVQDRDSDLVAATHGRGVFVLDIEALRQTTAAVATSKAHLFAVEPAFLWRMTSRGFQGHRDYRAANPPYGVAFHIWLADPPTAAPVLLIHDVTGAEVARVEGATRPGVQVLQWDARIGGNRLAAPGSYAVRWADRGDTEARGFRLLPDPASRANEASLEQPATENRE